jgi:hypothetical protein
MLILIRRSLANHPEISCIVGIIGLLNYDLVTTLDRVHSNFIAINQLCRDASEHGQWLEGGVFMSVYRWPNSRNKRQSGTHSKKFWSRLITGFKFVGWNHLRSSAVFQKMVISWFQHRW